jgi:hypothetical protein
MIDRYELLTLFCRIKYFADQKDRLSLDRNIRIFEDIYDKGQIDFSDPRNSEVVDMIREINSKAKASL